MTSEEKLLLLAGILSGEVDIDSLNEDSLIGFSYEDYFLALQILEDNKEASIILLGDALKAKADLFPS